MLLLHVSTKDIPAVLPDANTFVHRVRIDDDIVLSIGGEDAHAGEISVPQLICTDSWNRFRSPSYQ